MAELKKYQMLGIAAAGHKTEGNGYGSANSGSGSEQTADRH